MEDPGSGPHGPKPFSDPCFMWFTIPAGSMVCIWDMYASNVPFYASPKRKTRDQVWNEMCKFWGGAKLGMGGTI